MKLIPAKTIITKTKSNTWFGIDYGMNTYKGCNHGCIYCDSRSDCYRIDDFDTVRAKENAIEIIDRELSKKRKTGVVGTGAMSDPYNPYEKKYQLTRQGLEIIKKHGFGLSIATKSDLITRDIDIISDIAKYSPVIVKMTITSADDELCKLVEPNVCSTSKRFEAIKVLSENNIYAGLLMMPILPFIQDNEDNIREIVNLAYKNGAKFIYPAIGMTLRANQREWYYKQLDAKFPSIKQKYIQTYGDAYECRSPKSQELWHMFAHECNKLGIVYKMRDIKKGYKENYEVKQISLFD